MTAILPFTEQDRIFAQIAAERYAKSRTAADKESAFNWYQRLVPSSLKAYQYRLNREDYAELLQEGRFGLVKALDRYDPSRNTRFSTIAVRFITGYAQHYLERNRHAIRIPAKVQQFHTKLEETCAILSQIHLREPTYEEIAEYLDIDVDELCVFYAESPYIKAVSLRYFSEESRKDSDSGDPVFMTPAGLQNSIVPDNLFEDVDIWDRLSLETDPLKIKKRLQCSTADAIKLIELCKAT